MYYVVKGGLFCGPALEIDERSKSLNEAKARAAVMGAWVHESAPEARAHFEKLQKTWSGPLPVKW